MLGILCVLQEGQTVLHCAAIGGHEDLIDLLLTYQPDMITKANNVSEQLYTHFNNNIHSSIVIYTNSAIN